MIPVVLSGGSGTRLWPVSRSAWPKQFCEFLGESLFHKSIARLQPLGTPWTVTTRELKTLTEKTLRDCGIKADRVIYEPLPKNTGPAVAILCKVLSLKGYDDEVVGIFPADQLVGREPAFHSAVRTAEHFARQGEIVTLGIQPTYPATGYGYIETDPQPLAEGTNLPARKALRFREKPDEATAKNFLASGRYFWNAGMFIFRVSRMRELLKQYLPDVYSVAESLRADLSNLDQVYAALRPISIDYGLMEKLPGHITVPCDCDWSDLGTWDSLAQAVPKGAAREVHVQSDDCFVFPHTPEKSYAFVGVKDLLVVDTADALLIVKRGQSEKVKDVVDVLKGTQPGLVTTHPYEIRPWGRFEILRNMRDFKSKRMLVDPGAQISYQSHARRAEHWIIVRGEGYVILDGKTIPVQEGSYVHVPLGAKHRIGNSGQEPLEFIEVQLGTYFGEDDIIRYEDDYQRI
jgi:mannose-1-phosphate guanylyltransferase/mannose-6-phosphate isomerase